MEPLQWTTHEEPRDGPDELLEEILNHFRKGLTATVLGPPGVGKTFVLGKVKEDMEARGERVVCLAPTHAAARLLPDGDTVHHFVGKYAMQGAFKGWILLDEISMCCLPLLAALDQLRLNGTRIATFGDWDQLPPHPESNSWRGRPVSSTAFRESRLYRSWSDCTRFELTRCRRSDQSHFDFYTNLPQSLPKAIAESRKKYGPARDADLHVCISHKRQRAISTAKQARAADSVIRQGQECVEFQRETIQHFHPLLGRGLWEAPLMENLLMVEDIQ